eukprot:1141273-Pelagomonas_calceolata.AAC.7
MMKSVEASGNSTRSPLGRHCNGQHGLINLTALFGTYTGLLSCNAPGWYIHEFHLCSGKSMAGWLAC